jgi:hypothetical protein
LICYRHENLLIRDYYIKLIKKSKKIRFFFVFFEKGDMFIIVGSLTITGEGKDGGDTGFHQMERRHEAWHTHN